MCADLKTVSKKKLGTEIGKSAADKSRGLFSADDWQCSKCTNVNWARRTTCNVCNAPKFGEAVRLVIALDRCLAVVRRPLAIAVVRRLLQHPHDVFIVKVEARTGYGGGYNERGVVEYRRREESSDDEFDEFGRRKKRKRTSEPSTTEKPSKAEPGKANEDEEDEESGEEGDLSKYDLWGSDEEPTEKNNDDNAKADAPEKSDGAGPPSPNDENGKTESPKKDTTRRSRSSSPPSRSRSSSSSSDSSSSSKDSSSNVPSVRNRYDDFNLNSERENSPVKNHASSATSSRKKDLPKDKSKAPSKDKRRSRSRSNEKRWEKSRNPKGEVRSRERTANYQHRADNRSGDRTRNAHGRHRPYHSYGGRQR